MRRVLKHRGVERGHQQHQHHEAEQRREDPHRGVAGLDLGRLDERDHLLKFERGSTIDEGTHNVYVIRGDHAVRTPVRVGAASVSEIEVLHGLAEGDRVIVSDTRDFNDAPDLLIAN